MSTSLRLLDSAFRPYAEGIVQVARQYQLRPRVTSTFRSMNEQARLYDLYLRGRHPYPVAKPGASQHNYGLAIDLTATDLHWLGAVWRHWGGLWVPSDPIHFGAPR